MKTYLLVTVLAIFILAGCSSTKSTVEHDDVYYSRSDQSDVVETQTADPDYYTEAEYTLEDYETGEYVAYEEEPYYSTTETVENPDGTTYITNNYYEGYGDGDYYDYSYTDRINRFYSPYMGYNYYSPYYSSYYYNPWYWDYYWYMPSLYFSWGWGWGGCYYGYPYYSCYYPYNSYYYGYNAGYYDGYWDGYYGYDYYDNTTYNAPRPSRGGSNTPYTSRSGYSPQNSSNFNYFERTTPQLADVTTPDRSSTNTGSGTPGRTSTNTINNKGNVNPVVDGSNRVVVNNQTEKTNTNPQSQTGTRNIQPGTEGNRTVVSDRNAISGNSKNTTERNVSTKPRYTYKKPSNTRAKTNTRYQPGSSIGENNQTRPTQKYTKPASYTKPKQETARNNTQRTNTSERNTQKYTRPQSNTNKSYNRPTQYNTNRGNSQSSKSSNNYSTPSRSSKSNYSPPSRSSKSNYSQPSRSGNSKSNYSSPSRSSSSKSYSSPSRSGSSRSYSSPSRSSGSSGGGARSSGSRGGGGRR